MLVSYNLVHFNSFGINTKFRTVTVPIITLVINDFSYIQADIEIYIILATRFFFFVMMPKYDMLNIE